MRILITGAKGMLAKAVIEKFKDENELVLTDVADLDITNQETVLNYIEQVKPDCIINCAAYTLVDKAEEEKQVAELVNSVGPKNLAIAAEKNQCILMHISTDYVFGGEKEIQEEYQEDDPKMPNTVYGITKLQGEKNIETNCSRYYIFRTAWLYGEGNNFVRTMLRLGKENRDIKVVMDQYGSPTYATDLADIMAQALQRKIPYGVYHTTNIGNTTWFEFAKEIFEMAGLPCQVESVTSEKFLRMAKRPKNSKLSKEKILSQGVKIPEYQDALKRYLEKELHG